MPVQEFGGSRVRSGFQIGRGTKDGKANPVVSVKSGKQKRKAGQTTAAEVYEEVLGDKSHKKSKKSKRAH